MLETKIAWKCTFYETKLLHEVNLGQCTKKYYGFTQSREKTVCFHLTVNEASNSVAFFLNFYGVFYEEIESKGRPLNLLLKNFP